MTPITTGELSAIVGLLIFAWIAVDSVWVLIQKH